MRSLYDNERKWMGAALGVLLALCLGQCWTQAAAGTNDNNTPALQAEEVRGIWMWSSAVASRGAEPVAAELAQHHINKVFLLVKGASGNVCYPSKLAPCRPSGQDLLKEMLEACHKHGIEVHAWFVFNADNAWGAKHPGDAMYHAGKAEAWSKGPYSKADDRQRIPICPLAEDYRNYFKGLVQEVLEKYPVDGIHLDYIRYGHVCYCFCPRHQAFAAQHGIAVEHVRDAIYKTFYAPQKQSSYYFDRYRAGDKDVAGWVSLRQEEINSAVKEIRAMVKSKKPSLALSAAFMPEGGEADDTFALCHYAQNYATAGAELDYILPMTYGKSAKWIVQITHTAEQRSHRPVYSGLWASDEMSGVGVPGDEIDSAKTGPTNAPPLQLGEKVQALRKQGIKGFVLFRYGAAMDRVWKELP
jgi:uncharacterized lipoprotein YddW (UPF0748 family)